MQKNRDRPSKDFKSQLNDFFDSVKRKAKYLADKIKSFGKAFEKGFNKVKSSIKLFQKSDKKAKSSGKLLKKGGKAEYKYALASIVLILVFVVLFSVFSSADTGYVKPTVSNSSISYDADYTVKFYGTDSLYASAGVNKGQAVLEPTAPTSKGLYFVGWYDAKEGGNYISFPYKPTRNITLYPRFSDTVVLGFTGLNNKDGTLTYTDDIANVSGYRMNATALYVDVTSSLDNMFPFSEIEEFTDAEGNVFVKFPKCYIKFVSTSGGTITGFKVSNVQAEEDMFIPDCFLDPSDATGNTYLDYFALAKYEMSGSSSKGYSKSGETCLVQISRKTARTAARSYGTVGNYYNGYQLQDYSMTVLYNFLCMMYYKTSNIQTVYGGRTGVLFSWSSAAQTGTTDAISGLNGWNKYTHCVKMLGIENPYGNVDKWIDGITFQNYSIYLYDNPLNYSDSVSDGGGFYFPYDRPLTGSYINSLAAGNTVKTRSYVFINYTGANVTEYIGDTHVSSSNGVTLAMGGYYSGGAKYGLWHMDHSNSSGYVSDANGARLAYRPIWSN